MKPIETKYKGFRFRSRLEARWAVFMDSIGVRYRYEDEAFDLDGLYYLPDFWIPSFNAFLEIKPCAPTEEEGECASRLARHTGHRVFVAIGMPSLEFESDEHGNAVSNIEVFYSEGWDDHHQWVVCVECGVASINFEGKHDNLTCPCTNRANPRFVNAIERAIESARGFRFEPGARNEA